MTVLLRGPSHDCVRKRRTPNQVPCSLTALPALDSTYVVCSEDRMVNPDWSRRIAHDRLTADVIEIPGSHSPFLSRPKTLAEVLGGLAG
jgi:hypothetical protein